MRRKELNGSRKGFVKTSFLAPMRTMLGAIDMGTTGRRSSPILPWWIGGPLAAAAVSVVGRAIGLNATAAAGGYVLAVIVAVLVWGARSGLIAAVVSFLGLNFLFTEPVGTFAVGKIEDLVALAVFLVVSLVVSRLLAGLVAERLRAEQREREMSYLFNVSQSLLTGASLRQTLTVVARSLVDAFGLSGAQIRLGDHEDLPDEDSDSIVVGTTANDMGPPATFFLRSEGGTVVLHPGKPEQLDDKTLGLAETFVSQASLAVERASLDAKARRARLESEASDLRAALFSAVTHDLKTPLSSVKAAVTSLLDNEAHLSPEDIQSLLEMILAEADRLGRLLENVLDLARIQAGALAPRTEPADLAELVGALLQRLRPTMDGRVVDAAIADDLPEVAIDVVQIDQVLTNVVENAFRFCPDGSPIRISANRVDSVVEVRVSDEGPGIPVAERERVFDSFYRMDRGAGRGGSGLGLAISKAIVAAHRGRMHVEETAGGGTTIVFSLPVAPAP
jgi:two-component system sensor histidine kinase KdpD